MQVVSSVNGLVRGVLAFGLWLRVNQTFPPHTHTLVPRTGFKSSRLRLERV